MKVLAIGLAAAVVLLAGCCDAVLNCGQDVYCPDNHSCCAGAGNRPMCCPYERATCCSNGACCPFYYHCDTTNNRCALGTKSAPMLSKIQALLKKPAGEAQLKNKVCPDHIAQCPDTKPCCPNPQGKYGCCPFDKGVCCGKMGTCCEADQKCDKSNRYCVPKRAPNHPLTLPMTMLNPGAVTRPMPRIECPDGSLCPRDWTCCHMPHNEDSQNAIPLLDNAQEQVKSVKCPDKKTQCMDGQTCCNMTSGAMGCCNYEKGVCCMGVDACCPQDMICQKGRCYHKLAQVIAPMEEMTVAAPVPEVTDTLVDAPVKCDAHWECPANMTCCKTKSGKWGCCPMPKAVCCKDMVHCCPAGTKCGTGGTCTKSGQHEIVDATTKRPATPVKPQQPEKPVVCSPQWECPANMTCCMLDTGKWGCCPLPKAMCCPDKIHCCPNGSKCGKGGVCTKGELTVSGQVTKVAARARFVHNVICPDHQSQCPNKTTCCILADGKYGCCPLPNAVCCSDHVHCCPSGTTCNNGFCKRGEMKIQWYDKIPAEPVKAVQSVTCPDGQSQCPDQTTCCKLANGKYGCCPMPSAVCCNDHIHCCPEGTTCDVTHGKCLRGNYAMPWADKFPARPVPQVADVTCPDGQSQCPTGTTCCRLASGKYGCCPLPSAVCCNDHVHCCPQGTTCDVTHGKCLRGEEEFAWHEKFPAKQLSVGGADVTCPDGQSQCPTGTTCCRLASGKYGCCPLPSAVCCNDHVHCCPQGTTCDVTHGKCLRGEEALPWHEKFPAKSLAVEGADVTCPDGQSQCPTGTTCCKLASGKYGCCPLPSAVCCNDHVHCCPQGTTCDVTHGKCLRGEEEFAWHDKFPAKQISVEGADVTCPDGQSQCPTGTTCCRLASGKYGCCPLPSAVCCNDHVHCCPQGTTCDVTHGKCLRGEEALPWHEKFPAKSLAVEGADVTCPDGQSQCPTGTTCCRLASGKYGCCPLPSAVCCNDHIHCCPQGTTCDVTHGKCLRGEEALPWLEKFPAKQLNTGAPDVTCPDGQSQCPTGTTCCRLASGKYGCCPLPSAVCCNDHIHCCPQGTTCDVTHGKCLRGEEALPWHEKFPAKSIEGADVTCPDGQSQCPSGTTCCRLASGKYGCCPLPNAVCCSDHTHCCPQGTTCDVSHGRCLKGDMLFSWARNFPAKQLNTISKSEQPAAPVKCDAHWECPANMTCCKVTAAGKWGCCPMPKAVCCTDMKHCCPHDTKCGKEGACSKGDINVGAMVKKEPAQRIVHASAAKNVVCPGGGSECPDGMTCCQTPGGGYGCCPLPNAVCCSDKIHCCPQGTTCDTGSGKCNNQNGKMVAVPVKKLEVAELQLIEGRQQLEIGLAQLSKSDETLCTNKFICETGQGCCERGCCPHADGQCCHSRNTCCPRGTTCNKNGGCSRHVGGPRK